MLPLPLSFPFTTFGEIFGSNAWLVNRPENIFSAPRVLNYKGHGKPVDLWSIGWGC